MDTLIKYAVAALALIGAAIAIVWRERSAAKADVRAKDAAAGAAGVAEATAASDQLRHDAQAARDSVVSSGPDGLRKPEDILQPGDYRD